MSVRYTCEVHYEFEGIDESDRRQRELAEKMKKWFMDTRDKLVDLTNPMYEVWNAEFEMFLGKRDLVNNEEDRRLYNTFIADRINSIAKDLDGTANKYFIMRSDPNDEADFVGIYEHRKTKARIRMYITNLKRV